jgi:hypothetical protein
VSLPVRTGPSFTAIERAKYIVDKNHLCKVEIYFPYIDKQQYVWKTEFTKKEYLTYLYEVYGIYTNITYKLIECNHNILLKWNTCDFLELYHIIINPEYDYIIFEDPSSHFCTNILSYYLLDYRKLIFIHHTNYIDILPEIKPIKKVAKIIGKKLYIKKNIFNICYSESIVNSIINKKKRKNINNVITLPIHGIKDSFFIDTLPLKDSVYFMGKLDDSHKNIRKILEVTKNITDIHFYGIGKDENILYDYKHCIYHGTSTNIIKDVEEHKIYISYSDKEGICTTTIEALAINKYCLLLDCECNKIFQDMTNVFFFQTEEECKEKLQYLLTLAPQLENNKQKFTWEKANSVFYAYLHSIDTP